MTYKFLTPIAAAALLLSGAASYADQVLPNSANPANCTEGTAADCPQDDDAVDNALPTPDVNTQSGVSNPTNIDSNNATTTQSGPSNPENSNIIDQDTGNTDGSSGAAQ